MRRLLYGPDQVGVRRFGVLLRGLPWTADTWEQERATPAPARPTQTLRRVSPLEAMAIVKGG